MFTFNDLQELLANKERNDVCQAVGQIPDEELRNALVLLVMLYHKSSEIDRAVCSGK